MPVNTTKSADLLRFDVQPLQCLQAHSLPAIIRKRTVTISLTFIFTKKEKDAN